MRLTTISRHFRQIPIISSPQRSHRENYVKDGGERSDAQGAFDPPRADDANEISLKSARWSKRARDRQDSCEIGRIRRGGPPKADKYCRSREGAFGGPRPRLKVAKSRTRAVIRRESVFMIVEGFVSLACTELTLTLCSDPSVSRGSAECFVNSYSPAERRAEGANWSLDPRQLLRKTTYPRQPLRACPRPRVFLETPVAIATASRKGWRTAYVIAHTTSDQACKLISCFSREVQNSFIRERF
ncbi:hypothetical protein HN011_008039 [Eciton burchellii]|nr:hypothetical protein HN011_008039 [Eciton burchellii]